MAADRARAAAVDRLLEVPDVRAEQDRGAVGGRLDHVLPAALAVEAAADERHVRQAPQRAQLADRVDQDHGAPAGSGFDELALRRTNGTPERVQQPGHLVEAVRWRGTRNSRRFG